MRDIEEYTNKKAKTGNEYSQQKGVSQPQFPRQKWPTPSSSISPAPRNNGEHYGQKSPRLA